MQLDLLTEPQIEIENYNYIFKQKLKRIKVYIKDLISIIQTVFFYSTNN